MKIGVACGGTGGHIFPGLATAQVLKDRGHEVVLWLAGKDIESDAVAAWTGEKVTVEAQGFQSKNMIKVMKTTMSLVRAVRHCHRIMKRSRPDAVLAMGSYACVGPVRAALALDVPVVLHEANVIPGRMIKFFSKRATTVAGCFEETRHFLRLPHSELAITGMPLRKGLEEAQRQRTLPRMATFGDEEPSARPYTLLLMGGSRGSHALNEIASDAITQLRQIRDDFHVIHLTGMNDEQMVRERYEAAGVSSEVKYFLNDMVDVYTRTDIAICRSGAATCAELSLFGIPSLLVPYPYAVGDHQTENAKAMERSKAADFVREQDLDSGWLAEYLDGCLNSEKRRERMRYAAMQRAEGSGAENLADLVESMASPMHERAAI